MLRLRPYKSCDAEVIVSWIKDEYAFRQWCADRYDHFPITVSDINAQYNSYSEYDWFYPMTAFDESGVVGHMIMRFTDDARDDPGSEVLCDWEIQTKIESGIWKGGAWV